MPIRIINWCSGLSTTIRVTKENRDLMRKLAAKLKYDQGESFSNDDALSVVLEAVNNSFERPNNARSEEPTV